MERKPWVISNPTNGEQISPESKGWESQERRSKPGHKPLAIIDPSNGSAVDPVGMNFTPPKAAKPLSIIDPTSGEMVKV